MDKVQVAEKKMLNIFELSKSKLTTYIEDDEIKNILLSGRFGVGKTTFIEHYFKNKESDYELINISPVNYSVLSNQDIFRYIKYDILFILLEKVDFNLKSKETDLISWIEGLPIYLQANIVTILGSLIFLLPKIGKPAQKIFDLTLNHKKKFEEILTSANKDSDTKFIQSFYNKIQQEEGGLYENNEITEIINKILTFYSHKKKILVIDDLDRVDPQHIFRILNVLSAQSSRNKFFFEKVILVCDVKNIRSIFKAQYGQVADFSGYIDKFYDKEILYFDNRIEIASYIEEILNSIKFQGTTAQLTPFLKKKKTQIIKLLTITLSDSVILNQINLRSLLKYYDKTLIIKHREVSHKREKSDYLQKTKNHQILMMISFDILHKMLDLNLEKTLNFLSTKKSTYLFKDKIIASILPILNLNESPVNHNNFYYVDLESDTKIEYSLQETGLNDLFRAAHLVFRSESRQMQKNTDLPLVYNMMYKAFLKLKDNGYY